MAIPDVCQSTYQDDPCVRIGAQRLYGMTKDLKWARNTLTYASEGEIKSYGVFGDFCNKAMSCYAKL